MSPLLLTDEFIASVEFGWSLLWQMQYLERCLQCLHHAGFDDTALFTGANHYLPNAHLLHHHCSSNNDSIGISAPVVNT